METRANHVWVGAVTLLLLAALALAIVWIARLGQGDARVGEMGARLRDFRQQYEAYSDVLEQTLESWAAAEWSAAAPLAGLFAPP